MPETTATTENSMRSEAAMMELVLSFARKDERVRLVGMEGSRLDPDALRDRFQDYDVTYAVTDLESFTTDDAWLDSFGPRIIMQKPEAMELFPPSLGGWFSYLMLFEDGNRIDLKLVPLHDLARYRASEPRLAILLDKDQLAVTPVAQPPDFLTHIPTPRRFDDCCNEFWWVSTYVAKGICRSEFFYALTHLEQYVRPSLLRMLTWQVLAVNGRENVKTGKCYTYLPRYLAPETMNMLQASCRNDSYPRLWDSLFQCFDLFREASRTVADRLGFSYPDYDRNVSAYIEGLRGLYRD